MIRVTVGMPLESTVESHKLAKALRRLQYRPPKLRDAISKKTDGRPLVSLARAIEFLDKEEAVDHAP